MALSPAAIGARITVAPAVVAKPKNNAIPVQIIAVFILAIS
jgi:hypothetical protein